MAIGQLNPTQLSARLASMSDQQLQQYAALHQNDPYVMAIAMDVKNQRDAARRSATAPQTPPQDPVIQQLIARMAQLPPTPGAQGQQPPAQQLAQPPAPPAQGVPAPTATAADGGLMSGVATLPARNLERMADGGITGSADDDGMFDFAQRNESVIRVAEGGVPGYAAGTLTGLDFSAQELAKIEQMTPEERKEFFRQKAAARDFSKGVTASEVPTKAATASATSGVRGSLSGLANLFRGSPGVGRLGPMVLANELFGTSDKDLETLRQADEQRAATKSFTSPATAPSAADVAAYQDPNRPSSFGAASAAEVSPYADPSRRLDVPASARPAPAPGPRVGAAAPAGAKGKPSATPKGGIAELVGPPQPDVLDRFMATYGKPATVQELMAQATPVAAGWNKEIEESNKPFREQFAAERERLKKNEDRNIWQAVMQAGLGMLASPSSNFLKMAGEGGQRGLQMYQDAQKYDDAARKALMHSEMMLAQAERQERSGNREAAIKLMQAAEADKKQAGLFALKAQELKDTKEHRQAETAIHQQLVDIKRRELDVHQQRAAAETNKVTAANRAADLSYDNWLKGLSKIDLMSITPEQKEAKRIQLMREAYRQYGLTESTLPTSPSGASTASLVFNPQTGKLEPSR